ncbi:unnamed protein product [Rotaria sp. Silwood2]|nr:unnamed protein product [Rotaria sp. Silwood2]
MHNTTANIFIAEAPTTLIKTGESEGAGSAEAVAEAPTTLIETGESEDAGSVEAVDQAPATLSKTGESEDAETVEAPGKFRPSSFKLHPSKAGPVLLFQIYFEIIF